MSSRSEVGTVDDDATAVPASTTTAAPAAASATASAPTAPSAPTGLPGPTVGRSRRRLAAEVWIVLGLSLGQSALYAVVRLYARYTAEVPLAQQSATLNPTRSPRPYLDLTYQLMAIGFALVPVVLALYLLSSHGRSALRRIGLDAARPGRDFPVGLGLAAVVGIPGLGVYVAGRALGVTVEIQAAGLEAYWWTVPVLVLSALQNSLLEEVVAVGYLVERLEELRWGVPAVIAASALLRGAYHLYQGPGMAAGNVVMGVLFGWYYVRRRRVMPLVVAHTALDVVAFVGYAALPEDVLTALRIG
ncbi:CPBP family intramembrane glutamic endopeptidase [Actinotalea sp. Marseille-Q4924]|uniref:CPBP family intramembrane glutamic endopeptidase n=1 Tax=Actinotalea sp. Marseille-Q4924 TaxID=2866571 RepID=UPI001CE4512D|nr:CPBP family intramembrane glutamic endopeptidase [Actinotalea sp. Marseille-Q4924]